uniref:Receptor ligand binding region domain-containing protein n=1 Tax=Timema poppense TaxID=170557 RepID=A0A7R9D8Q9_TIMPO|nr:unnamed protein product [Timema poppensis]
MAGIKPGALSSVDKQVTNTATLLARYRETGGSVGLDALVTEVTVKMVQKQTCLGIITDQAHQDVFNTAFFRKLGDTPYLKVLVKDNEDLLSPNYGTLEVIRQIRKDGCHSYVILLSNGAQMARLLRFGDSYKTVVADTVLVTSLSTPSLLSPVFP